MRKSGYGSRKRTNLFAILLGLCLSMILHFVLSLPGALIMNAVKNPSAAVGIVGALTHLACGIITAFAICRYKAEGALFCCLVYSLAFFLLALGGGIFTDGKISLTAVINSAIYTAVSVLFAAVFKWAKRKRR